MTKTFIEWLNYINKPKWTNFRCSEPQNDSHNDIYTQNVWNKLLKNEERIALKDTGDFYYYRII